MGAELIYGRVFRWTSTQKFWMNSWICFLSCLQSVNPKRIHWQYDGIQNGRRNRAKSCVTWSVLCELNALHFRVWSRAATNTFIWGRGCINVNKCRWFLGELSTIHYLNFNSGDIFYFNALLIMYLSTAMYDVVIDRNFQHFCDCAKLWIYSDRCLFTTQHIQRHFTSGLHCKLKHTGQV